MAAYLFFWKCWLKANLLARDITDDYIAEVSTIGTTLRNKDIAQRLVASRTQYKYEDILNILTQADELNRQAVAEGSSVLGTWTGGNVIIDGSYIKVDKGDGTTNGSIFFMDSEGNAHGVTLPLTVNDPSRVICTVPENLTAGEYTVKINTRYTDTKKSYY